MNMPSTTPRPFTYWIISGMALVWNLIGMALFAAQVRMTPEQVAMLTPQQQLVHNATPAWVQIAFGVAVVFGVLGSLMLLWRKRFAIALFVVSLLAIVVQTIGAYAFTPAWQAYGPGGLAMPIMVVVIAVYLVWYARAAARKGWLD